MESPSDCIVNETFSGTLAGVFSGKRTVTGTVVRLPADKETSSLENDTSTPGSSVMFSSSTTEKSRLNESSPFPGFSSLKTTSDSSSTSTRKG